MKIKMLVFTLAFVLALAPMLGSVHSAPSEDYLIKADGFTISINSDYPALSFYRENATEASFSISYDALALYLYGEDMGNPEYISNLSSSLWKTTIGKSTEEDGTVRTVVTMNSTINLSGASEKDGWALLSFSFLILANGDRAQLGISMSISDMKPIESCSNLAIIQSIDGDATFIPAANEIIVSDIYYRWNPTATVDMNGLREERDVGAQYSDGSLSLVYPYSQNMVRIMHISGQVDLGHTAFMRDYFSDAIGYSLGIITGFGLFGISYAVKGKKKKSPFDMDSPIYRK